MSEGMMYRRGPNGEIPDGQSINGKANEYGNIPLNGEQGEHVTNHWGHSGGGHVSWNNPGPNDVHHTDHTTGKITDLPS